MTLGMSIALMRTMFCRSLNRRESFFYRKSYLPVLSYAYYLYLDLLPYLQMVIYIIDIFIGNLGNMYHPRNAVFHFHKGTEFENTRYLAVIYLSYFCLHIDPLIKNF